jgi:magnesium-transporting ATPase (P-type)
VLLWVAAVLAALAGMPQLAIAIVIVVAVDGGFAFVQEYRADRAAERLRDLLPVAATVRRDGHRMTVPASELVPGDVVILESGGSSVNGRGTGHPGEAFSHVVDLLIVVFDDLVAARRSRAR